MKTERLKIRETADQSYRLVAATIGGMVDK